MVNLLNIFPATIKLSLKKRKKLLPKESSLQTIDQSENYFLAFTSIAISISLLIIHSAGSASEVPNLIPQSALFTVNLACTAAVPSATSTLAGK